MLPSARIVAPTGGSKAPQRPLASAGSHTMKTAHPQQTGILKSKRGWSRKFWPCQERVPSRCYLAQEISSFERGTRSEGHDEQKEQPPRKVVSFESRHKLTKVWINPRWQALTPRLASPKARDAALSLASLNSSERSTGLNRGETAPTLDFIFGQISVPGSVRMW